MTETKQNEIIAALGLEFMSAEEQEATLLKLGELIAQGTQVRLVERMDDATRDAFSKLLSSNASEEEVHAFISEHVSTEDEAVKETIDELADDILAVTK